MQHSQLDQFHQMVCAGESRGPIRPGMPETGPRYWPTSAVCNKDSARCRKKRRKKTRNVQILLQVIIASWSRADGALVIMVLSKGNLEEFFSIHNTRRPVARRRDATGEWIKLWSLIVSRRKRRGHVQEKTTPSCTLPHPGRDLLPPLTAQHVWDFNPGRACGRGQQ